MPPDIRLIAFDVNGTLIVDNSWLKLNLAFGMTPAEDAELWQLNAQGALPFTAWVEAVSRIYRERGLATCECMEQALFTYSYLDGARETVAELLRRGYVLSLVSGAPDMLVERIARDLGIGLWGGNGIFSFDANGHFSSLVVRDEEPEAKLAHVMRWEQELSLDPSQIACVGDGANDDLIFRHTGRGVTFPGSSLEPSAWKVALNLHSLLEVFP